MSRKFMIGCLFLLHFISCTSQTSTTEPNLQYLVRKSNITDGSKTPMLILLHGYGSNEADLFSFAQYIPKEYTVIAAKAPIELASSSYAWYTIKRNGNDVKQDASSSSIAKLNLKKFIEAVVAKENGNSKKVVLLGFSQGAIMSFSMAINYPNLIAGVAIMSGRILEEDLLIKNPKTQNVNFFISHGIDDKMISLDKAREAKSYLNQQNISPTYKEYLEGHTISEEMLNDFLLWLNDIK